MTTISKSSPRCATAVAFALSLLTTPNVEAVHVRFGSDCALRSLLAHHRDRKGCLRPEADVQRENSRSALAVA